MAHTRFMLDKQGYMHARAHILNICYFSTATMIHERASMLRCTYIVCLVFSTNTRLVLSVVAFTGVCPPTSLVNSSSRWHFAALTDQQRSR